MTTRDCNNPARSRALAAAVLFCACSCQRAESSPNERSADTNRTSKTYHHRHAANHTPQGPETLPPPTERQLRGFDAALDAVEAADADMRYFAALTGLMYASSGRIPPQLASDVLAFGNAATRERQTALLTLFDNSAWVFDQVCGQRFESLFAEGRATRSYRQMARHVWAECKLDRFGLLEGEAAFVESVGRTGVEPLLAYFVYGYLDTHGGAHPTETELLRETARGNPTPPQPASDVEAWLAEH